MKDRLKDFKKDLRTAGVLNPQLLMNKLQKIRLSDLELEIIRLRYIDGLLIKQIVFYTHHCENWIKKVNQKATNKILDGLTTADLVELGINPEAPARLLYYNEY